jgi:hypothetical protein
MLWPLQIATLVFLMRCGGSAKKYSFLSGLDGCGTVVVHFE